MPMFAVYYIPPAESDLYKMGAQILGYDIRTETLLTDNPIRNQFDNFDPEWSVIPQQFGIHATIGHTLYYDEEMLPEIEAEIESILNLFDPDKHFWLTPDHPYIPRFSQNITVYYSANQAFQMFHALIIARVHPLGTHHPLKEEGDAGYQQYMTGAWAHRIEQYHHFGILDDWHPHLGLLRPIPEVVRQQVRQQTLALLPTPTPLTVDTICLLVRDDDATHFRIHREFSRADYPTQPNP